MSSKTVVKLWLEIIFDAEEAEKLVEQCPKEELRKAILWYRAYKKDLHYLGLRNQVLESLLSEYDEPLPKDELQANLRAFMERFYYEAFIRKAGRGTS